MIYGEDYTEETSPREFIEILIFNLHKDGIINLYYKREAMTMLQRIWLELSRNTPTEEWKERENDEREYTDK